MLEFFEFRTWETTLLVFLVFITWGFLRERARRKRLRIQKGVTQRLAKQILLYSSTQPTTHPPGQSTTTGNWAEVNESYPILPLSGDPVDTNDRYVMSALGMESNRQDFYRQAWEASRNNEYTAMKPGSW